MVRKKFRISMMSGYICFLKNINRKKTQSDHVSAKNIMVVYFHLVKGYLKKRSRELS